MTDSRVGRELGALTRELGIKLRVRLGLKVAVRDLTEGRVVDYRVVSAGDIGMEAGHVSRNSPIGHALLAARQGDETTVRLPAGERRIKVLQVHAKGSKAARRLVAWTLGEAADAGLGRLPWVFVADVERALRLVPCGPSTGADPRSIQLEEPWALVAAPSDTEIETRGDHAGVVDVIRTGTRRLWRVRGTVGFLTADGSLTTIKAVGPAGGTRVEYELHGKQRRFGRTRTPVFLGPPAMRKRKDGKLQGAVPEQDLQWKPELPGSAWRRVPSAEVVLGFGVMRYVEEGVVGRSVQLCVLPDRAALRIRPSPDPRRGEAWLLGFGKVEAEVVAPAHVRASVCTEGRTHRLELLAESDVPPREVIVALTWHGRDDLLGQAKLRVPFPTEHVALFGARGQELAPGSVLTPQQLAGARAEAVAPEGSAFEVRSRCAGRNAGEIEPWRVATATEVPATSPGQYSLDLAALQPAVADALALDRDLHGAVELTVGRKQGGEPVEFPGVQELASPSNSSSIVVMRFDLRLERRDAGSSVLDLDQPSREKTTAGELASLQVEALPLLDPDLKPLTLERESRTSWRAPEQRLVPGPCLVVGRGEGRRRLWPLIWHAGTREHRPQSPSSRPRSAEEAYASTVDGSSAMAFQSVAVQIGAKPSHDDWKLVFGYLREASLPVQVFPLLRGLASTPRACATAAFLASDQDFDLLWRRMEELPFAWWQVPPCCWRDALDSYAEHMREEVRALGGMDLAQQVVDDSTASRVARLRARLDGLDDIL